MATTAHCAYCFEILAADLEERTALEYRQVQDLWTQYELLGKPEAKDAPSARENQKYIDGDDLEDNDSMMDGITENDELEDEEDEEEPQPKAKSPTLQLPSISRLQALSPASASSSSSTPSSLSTSSSSAALNGNSKSSSNSSFFSFGRSKQPSPGAPPREEEHPLFVTWNVVSPRSGHQSLRGCIGTFDAKELSSGLRSYALTA